MPSAPSPPMCSKREFFGLAFTAVRAASRDVRKIWLDNQVLTKLYQNMKITVATKERPPEALAVIMHAIATRATARDVTYAQVEDLIAETAPAQSDGEEEWIGDASLAETPLYGIRKVLNTFRRDGKLFCLIDWEPSEEPAEKIPRGMVAQFRKQRRAIVERAYIEAEAIEAQWREKRDNARNRTLH